MAKTVNYAGTVLSLNTDKYSKSLKAMKTESLSTIKQISSGFKSMLAPLAGLIGVTSSFRQIVSSMKDYESKVSSLTAITGDLQQAKVLFQDLNNLSRKIPQSFDEITSAATSLNKVGLKPSEETIKALSAIAIGTGQSLSSVAQTLSSASMNRLKSLQTLGIQATRVGDQIEMTFKGQKTTIEATNVALEQYMQNLAKQNFSQTLDFQMQGMTGATKNLSDAWSDLWTTISTGQVGQEIAKTIFKASQALDKFTSMLNSPEMQQIMGGFVRLFTGAFDTIVEGIRSVSKPFVQFFSNLTENGEKTAKAEIGYFEGWFDFVRLGLGDLISTLDTWWQKTLAYAERFGSWVAEQTHGSTQEIMQQQALQLRMARKVKEMGLETTALMKRNGKVDMSAIMQLPKGHPLLDYYMEQRKAVVDQHKGMTDAVAENEKAFQQQLREIEDNARKERNQKYDELVKTRIDTLNKLNEKIDYAGIKTLIPKTGNGGSKGLKDLADKAEEARKAYKGLVDEINRMEFDKKDPIEQENINYANRINTLRDALAQQAITQEEFNTTEERLIALHLDKLSELYSEHYKEEAEKRNQALQEMKQREEDWNSNSTVLDQFSEKLAKYNLNWANLISGDFSKAKLTGTQIVGVYSQAGKAISDYFGNVAQGFEKNSGIYKGLFALQKGFAVASSMVSMYQGAMNAMAAPYPANLIAWAQVIGQGLQIIGQLKSVNYSGAYDKGGNIPAGKWGIVGEVGPEIVQGPASVTSRKDTEDLMKNNGNNVTVNLIEDSSRAGQVNQRNSETDKQMIIDVIVSNIRGGGDVASAMSGTYGLARQGY